TLDPPHASLRETFWVGSVSEPVWSSLAPQVHEEFDDGSKVSVDPGRGVGGRRFPGGGSGADPASCRAGRSLSGGDARPATVGTGGTEAHPGADQQGRRDREGPQREGGGHHRSRPTGADEEGHGDLRGG